ncbi:MAG: hypothetical protein R6V84_14490, partial [Desulfobacterales bacterium]
MSRNSPADGTRVALVAPPWSLYTRPSIQAGALKAFSRSRFSDLPVAAHHVHLMVAEAVGYRRYHCVSERTWLAESVFAALLYPERFETIARFFARQAGTLSLKALDFRDVTRRAQAAVEGWLASVDWPGVRLVGVTSALCQFTAALYIARRIKALSPGSTTVIGGPAFTIASGPAALEFFPEIDVVVAGEGELPLAHLIQHHVLKGCGLDQLPPVAAILTRFTTPASSAGPIFYQLQNLDHLPLPDYGEYVETLSGFDPSKRFFPTLPVAVALSANAVTAPIFINKWGTLGSANGEFNQPDGIAIDSGDSVYVVDRMNSRVQKFSNDGVFLTSWALSGHTPTYMAIDEADNVYVSIADSFRVQKYSSDGALLETITTGVGVLMKPVGLATDTEKNLYVGDEQNSVIQKFSSEGEFIMSWGGLGSSYGQFDRIAGVATDADGFVYAVDVNNNRIQKFSGDGVFVSKIIPEDSFDRSK